MEKIMINNFQKTKQKGAAIHWFGGRTLALILFKKNPNPLIIIIKTFNTHQ